MPFLSSAEGYGWQESCALASQERTPSNPASTSHVFEVTLDPLLQSFVDVLGSLQADLGARQAAGAAELLHVDSAAVNGAESVITDHG